MITNKINSLTPPLACPICHAGFEFQSSGLVCRAGHFFNFSKSGTVNFISQKINEKPDAFYHAEQTLHGLTPYRQLIEAVLRLMSDPGKLCLTGSSLGRLLTGSAIGFEVSSRSVDLQLKADPALSLFVAQASRLPLPDASMDLVVRLDEQIDMAESLRALKPSGTLLRILPARTHLLEVRRHLFSGRRQGQREKPELIRAIHQLENSGWRVDHQGLSIALEPSESEWAALLEQWGPVDPRLRRQVEETVDSVTFAWELYLIRLRLDAAPASKSEA